MSKSISNSKKSVHAKSELSTGSKVSKSATAKKGGVAKLVKPAKAPKAAKPATEGGRKGRALPWPNDAKIKMLPTERTFREGSIREASYNTMKKSATVGDYLAAGGASKHLGRFEELELVKIG